MAAVKQQQLQQLQLQQQQLNIRTALPNFNLSKDDMGNSNTNFCSAISLLNFITASNFFSSSGYEKVAKKEYSYFCPFTGHLKANYSKIDF
jgi:hypothetical protein